MAKANSKPAAKRVRRSKQHPDHNPKAGVRVMPVSKQAQERETELDAARKRTEFKSPAKAKAEKDDEK